MQSPLSSNNQSNSLNNSRGLGIELQEISIVDSSFESQSVSEINLNLTLNFAVKITNPKGVWPVDLSRNKQAWIEREIILWLLQSKLKLNEV